MAAGPMGLGLFALGPQSRTRMPPAGVVVEDVDRSVFESRLDGNDERARRYRMWGVRSGVIARPFLALSHVVFGISRLNIFTQYFY